jgi:uncharacterized Zn finger protein (UPF0148 family)
MLSGWKMLATHCPICYSALLAKDKRMQCASCNVPVMTQETYDSGKENNVDSSSVNSSIGVNYSTSSGGNGVVYNTNQNSNDLYESFEPPSSLASEIAKSRQIQEQLLSQVSILATADIYIYIHISNNFDV